MATNGPTEYADRNLCFSGLLDSAKTAHPVPSATELNNWWMPRDEETHVLHCAAAEVATIRQALMGELIQLPRNQSFDSPAWFKMADYFIKSRLPLFSICVLGKSATPEAFVADCAEQFKPTSPFALSAWPDLTDTQRRFISENISTQGSFKGMLDGVVLDSQWQTTFEAQRDTLQKVLEYLENNYRLESQLIRKVDFARTTTWKRIHDDYTDPQFFAKMSAKHGEKLMSDFRAKLEEIKAKAEHDFADDPRKINSWLSGRTNLYREIYREPHELREILRAEIDRCYVETTSESVTGIGRFSDADRSDTGRPIDERLHDSAAVDANNDPNGLEGYYVVDFENARQQQKSSKDFLEVLNDKGVADQIRLLRRIRSWGEVEGHHLAEAEQAHVETLCHDLPNAVRQHKQKWLQVVWHAVPITVSMYIGLSTGATGGALGGIEKELISAVIGEAASTALDALKLREQFGKLIFEERQVALAGILREWLTKPMRVDDRKSE